MVSTRSTSGKTTTEDSSAPTTEQSTATTEATTTDTERTTSTEETEQSQKTITGQQAPRSHKSTKSQRHAHRVALAREELARKEVELAAARLAVIEAAEYDTDEDTVVSEREAAHLVDSWLNSSRPHLLAIANEPHSVRDQPTEESRRQMRNEESPTQAVPVLQASLTPGVVTEEQHPPAPQAIPQQNSETQVPPPHRHTTTPTAAQPPTQTPAGVVVTATPQQQQYDIAQFTSAITCAIKAARHPSNPGPTTELPIFNGAYQDWLSFRAAYYESTNNHTEYENLARLRRSLKGIAKEAVSGLFVGNARAEDIMRKLESRFGRADSIALTELDRLRALPRLTDSPKEICIFSSRVSNSVATLQALDRIHYLYNPEITKITIEKLTPTVRRQWFQFAATQPKEEPDLQKLARFLEYEAELCGPYAQPEAIGPDSTTTAPPRRTQRTLVTTENQPKCPVCSNVGHSAPDCKQFREADPDVRWDLAKTYRLCFRCLRYRNRTHHCKARKCEKDGCPQSHHRLLHFTRQREHEKTEDEVKTESVTSTWTPKKTQSYLKMIPVHVSGPTGATDAYALLDDGSTVTLIDSDLANRVGAKGPVKPLNIEAIADTKIAASKSRRVTVTLQGPTGQHKIQAQTIHKLQLSPQAVTEKDVAGCEHLRDIQDSIQYDDAKPKILIGQDNWHLLLATEVRKGQRNQPIASLTPLGWVLHGTHTRAIGQRVHFVHHLTTIEDNMDEQLKQYFAIDALTINPKKPQSDPEQRALAILNECVTETENGHYEAPLLWKRADFEMPDNYDNAVKRLATTEKKISKDVALKEKYCEQMAALVKKGYAESAPQQKTEKRTWYLPHFAVVNPMKPGKIRIVHDAAAKTKGVSLNDHLLTGPDLLQSLPGVLMRFRQYPVAVSADIAEMFMQVKIRSQDRDALRYLWRGGDDGAGPIQEYRMTSLIFGATSSPSTAIYVKNLNASKYSKTHPRAVTAITNNHYVDDYLDSFQTTEEAVTIATQVRDIHRNGHFELRQWMSNSREVLRELGHNEVQKATVDIGEETKIERVLGLVWKPTTDELAFNLDMARIPPTVLQSDAPTKREALKIVMSLFDPLGLASPVTVRAKQILQEVWRRGTDWDQQLDTDLAAQWSEWMTHLQDLRDITIPRCYLKYATASSLQLHVFVDASESAYAAALYWRAEEPNGQIGTTLILAKARVAPLKLTSIPRLELQAAVMGSRMAVAVLEEHQQKPESTTYWTDSRTVLTWLKTGSRSYKPFVAHRIAAIEENSAIKDWRWVPTKYNAADHATRDVPQNFDRNHVWYTGPSFLNQDPSSWPTEQPNQREVTGEEKVHVVVEKKATTKLGHCLPDNIRFSTWEKYLRSTARVLQFITLCRRRTERAHYKRTTKNKEKDPDWKRQQHQTTLKPTTYERKTRIDPYVPIEAELIRTAEQLIVRASQEESFPEEIAELRNHHAVSSNSRLRSISVYLSEGTIKLKGRVGAARDITEELKNPPVLDGNHRITQLWIEYTHRKLLHAGVEATINECRQHYWILRIRPTTRVILHRCLPCRIRRNTPPQPPTGDHPASRLAHHRRPFTFTGLDYFGPLTVTVGRTTQKRYVALFTCLTTRAIHLELAASLSTDSAVMALRRMIARRGCPTEIWSDNGTNLRGADAELRRAADRALEEEASRRTIRWRYIPPAAPFMGGAWERMVRSVKVALSIALHERHPTEEVLATVLAEAEYTVNNRPLTHVSVDPTDPEAITPNHFLLGGSARVPVPGVFDDHDLIGRAHWRASQRLADIFWSRWLREYLPELQNRREPHGRGPALQTGNIVLVADGTLPRNTWPRGKVVATYPGRDGIVRAVDVQTSGGILRRPTKKLVLLPTDPMKTEASPNVL